MSVADEEDGQMDVQSLIQESMPQPRSRWAWGLVAAFAGLLIGGEYLAGGQEEPLGALVYIASAVGVLVLVMLAVIIAMASVRRQRAEQQAVMALEEMIQLRRWDDAQELVMQLLSKPMRQRYLWAQTLVWLSMVLTRRGRYGDAIMVNEYLLEHVPMDGGVGHGIRLSRAMAMLHEDRLVDVDRAIGELKRESRDQVSAGLALVEMYRDVKTGHADEALGIFQSRRQEIRDQLGHRSGDAWALAAHSYDRLGRQDEAQAAYENATLLSSLAELRRRYPELELIVHKYTAAAMPEGVA